MTPEERAAFVKYGVVPAGWRWCPDCNGEGVVVTMAANPDLTETQRDCGRCEAAGGIVPVEP